MSDICFDIETTGLDLFKDRITAIDVGNNFGGEALVDKDEKELLKEFWTMVKKNWPYIRLIGFNCYSFNVPFLIIRSFKHKVKVIGLKGRVLDLRFMLSNGNKYQKGKLNEYAKLIGLETKYKGYNGSDAIRLWNENKLDELREYVLTDAKITYLVYKRAKEINLVK